MCATRKLNVLFLTLTVSILAAAVPVAQAQGPGLGEIKKPFVLDQVIAFYGAPQDIGSANFVLSGDWQYWKSRGGVASRGITHQQFLRKSVDEAANILVNLGFHGNPSPVLTIDEFGWDYDGGIDRHSAGILGRRQRRSWTSNSA